MEKLIIRRAKVDGSHKQGSLSSVVTAAQISEILGIAPEDGGDEKVNRIWNFTVDGHECAIWDYRGRRWSTFGPRDRMRTLFGPLYTPMEESGWL